MKKRGLVNASGVIGIIILLSFALVIIAIIISLGLS